MGVIEFPPPTEPDEYIEEAYRLWTVKVAKR
jgi:hypothetical protein